MLEFEFSSTVRRSAGGGSWHFLALPEDLSRDIEHVSRGMKAAWGSVRVRATIGATTWSTSIFPEKSSGTFLLPVKAEVRRAEGVADGDAVTVVLALAP